MTSRSKISPENAKNLKNSKSTKFFYKNSFIFKLIFILLLLEILIYSKIVRIKIFKNKKPESYSIFTNNPLLFNYIKRPDYYINFYQKKLGEPTNKFNLVEPDVEQLSRMDELKNFVKIDRKYVYDTGEVFEQLSRKPGDRA